MKSSLRAQPRLLLWGKKARAETNRGFYPLCFTQATWDKSEIAGLTVPTDVLVKQGDRYNGFIIQTVYRNGLLFLNSVQNWSYRNV